MILLYAFLCFQIALTTTCDWDVDFVILQDTSESYLESMKPTQDVIAHLVDLTDSMFARGRFAVSSFIDKPIPFRGIGNGRGNPEELDYCYRRESNFLENPDAIKKAHTRLAKGSGSGGDGPENIYEAMIYSAIDLDIYSRFTLNSERQRVKFVIAATDDLPHYQNDSKIAIDQWNEEITQIDSTTAPHFLDKDFLTYDFGLNMPVIFGDLDQRAQEYDTLVNIKSQTESAEYKQLIDVLGPRTYAPPKEFGEISDPNFSQTGSSPHSRCANFEYPSLDDLKIALNSRNVYPVVLISSPKFVTRESATYCTSRGYDVDVNAENAKTAFLECLRQVYESDFSSITDAFVVMDITEKTDATATELVNKLKLIGTDLECKPTPGIGPWIAGATAGAAALMCFIPCASKNISIDIKPTEGGDEINHDIAESSYSAEAGDTCSWDNYI